MLLHKIECFCDDRKVAKVTRLLAGIGVLDCKVTPVLGAEVTTNGELQQSTPGQTTKASALMEALKPMHDEVITRKDAHTAGHLVGIVGNSVDQALSKLVKDQKLRRIGSGQYEVCA